MTVVAFALAGLLAVAAPAGKQLSGPQLDARTDEIGALLRCPVCQGLSVADSPATMARNMKAEVREKLAAGYDQEQILEDFERSYGEFVRLKPSMQGMNWVVWLGPVGGLLAGGAMIARALKRRPRNGSEPETAVATSTVSDLPTRNATPGDARLAAAVRRVRMLAYGWPDGVSPEERS